VRALKTIDTCGTRPLIFLIVLMSHVVIVVVIVREGRLVLLPKGAHEPLLLMLLRGEAPAIHSAQTPRAKGSRPHAPKRERVAENAIDAPPGLPPESHIDWQHEAELAAQNFLADAEKEKNYRDLSGLSAAQRDWIKKNQMKPAPPGIAWQHPRFEFDRQTGLPMFWINDRCVWIMLMVFCGVGHTEADGGLFNHLRDLLEP
jgi:hypothetical protein